MHLAPKKTQTHLQTRTGHIIHCGDERLETEPTLPPRYADGLLNNSHLMFKHPSFLVDAHKWCDNKVETRDVHGALKPLHGSQRRTQIVASVSKVAWMRVTQMPSHQTRNHAWCVAHQISPFTASRQVQMRWKNHSGPCTLSADL